MTERSAAAGARTEMTFKVGPSDLEWKDGVLTLNFDEVSVPRPPAQWLPKRIKGTLRLDAGAITQQSFSIDAKGEHQWWPIAPSSRISLAFDDGDIPDWCGHGYLDCNWGLTGLEEAFTRWDWARGDLPDGRTVIFYDTQRRDGSADCLCLSIAPDGSFTHLDTPARTELGKGFWGVKRVGHSDAGTVPYVKTVLEDGPFYARSVVQTQFEGQPLTLMHESLSGDRFASNIIKAMLCFRMPRRKL
ncbi:MAG: carotenoid 1,2-hydratase [Ahrensia sp.]